MTGKENHGREAWSQINTSFTKAGNELYVVDKPTAGHVEASARSWTEIAGNIAKGVISAGKEIAGAPKRGSVYGRTHGFHDYSNQSDIGGYDNIKYVSDYIDPGAKPAKQKWLKYVTGIGKYVFGASVDAGEDEGIYADANLLENAGKYVRTKAKEYVSDFVQALLTVGKPASRDDKSHERAHLDGVESENVAEEYAVKNIYKLGARDSLVDKALKQYRNHFSLAA